MSACPRLRPLEMFPADLDGRRVICLRDPAGVSDRVAFVPEAAAAIIAGCDGRRDAAEVAAWATRRLGQRIRAADVEALIAQLDDALLLDSPRFHAHERARLEAWRARPTRPVSHVDDDAGRLGTFIDAQLAGARGRVPRTDVAPRVVVAPHIDFGRGGPVYGDAYRGVADVVDASPYDLVVVFGTDHNGIRQPFSLTRKHYETPFGAAPTDLELVDALAAGAPDALFLDEPNHRHEHSVEFQVVWLRRLFGARLPPLLPILCGPIGDGSGAPTHAAREVLARLAALTRARRTLIVAGADLAHVGPRFGDEPFGPAQCAEVEAADRRALARIVAGDADGFYGEIVAERDRFKVCGTSPIWASLALAELVRPPRRRVRGQLRGYAQCPADGEPGGRVTSWVSIAAAALDDDMS
jgi:hypothetical protein